MVNPEGLYYSFGMDTGTPPLSIYYGMDICQSLLSTNGEESSWQFTCFILANVPTNNLLIKRYYNKDLECKEQTNIEAFQVPQQVARTAFQKGTKIDFF